MHQERTCRRCGERFSPRTTGGAAQVDCPECKGKRPLRTCERCNARFAPLKNGSGTWCDGCRARGCVVDGCGRPLKAVPYCQSHAARAKRLGDPLAGGKFQTQRGSGSVDKAGYRMVSRDGRRMAEHRFVMEDVLGRPLGPNESVHHKNGIRHDNRPANLELWVTESGKHRKGQRVEDLVAWVVATYPEFVDAALNDRPQLRLLEAA